MTPLTDKYIVIAEIHNKSKFNNIGTIMIEENEEILEGHTKQIVLMRDSLDNIKQKVESKAFNIKW